MSALHCAAQIRGPAAGAHADHQADTPQCQSQSGIWPCETEGEGFEPSKRLTTLNGFRDSYVMV